jgi:hypothetical protein
MEETKKKIMIQKQNKKQKSLKETILRYDRVCSLFQNKKLTRHV